MVSNARKWTVAFLILAGFGLYLLLQPHTADFNPRFWDHKQVLVDNESWIERLLLGAAFIIAAWAPVQRRILTLLDMLRQPSDRARRWTALSMGVGSSILLYGLGIVEHRLMLPMWHDENMYRMQTTFLCHGKFCMPGLPSAIADFFESPYIFVRDVYGPVYFPGTAMLHVPAALLHLPYWLTPLIIAGVSIALLYLIVTELIDGVAGCLAVVLMISLMTFRWFALVEMSHAAGLMWGLIALWAWLSWRRTRNVRWIVLAGAAAGWYAITRPLDGLSVLMPIALAWACDLRHAGWKKIVVTALLATVAAAPFFAVQLAFDRALTGRMFEAPLDRYNRTYFNVRSLGLQRFDPSFEPPTPVPQIKAIYHELDRTQVSRFTTVGHAAEQWWRVRLPSTWGGCMPTLLLIVLVPAAFAGLKDVRQWVFLSMSWFYLLGAAFFYIFGGHYAIAAAGAVIFTLLMGMQAIEKTWPQSKFLQTFLPVAVLLLAGRSIVAGERNIFEPFPGRVSRANYLAIPNQVRKPAIVMFRFGKDEEAFEEPVYNWDVLSPDDAPLIRAHDLGASRNIALFRYYAKVQPNRTVYFFDRESLKLSEGYNVSSLSGLSQLK